MIGLLSPGSQPDAAASRPPRPVAPVPRPAAPTEPVDGGGDAPQPRRAVCPFCGTLRDRADGPCERCTMADTPESRRATRARVGPWYVLQARNPAAPGMQLELLLAFVRRGQVTPRSIVRGPTTYQLWRFAANARGLSRAFGLCYSCQSSLEPTAVACPKCHKSQEPPLDPHALLDVPPAPASTGPAAVAAVTSNPVMRELPRSAPPPPPAPAAPQTPAATPVQTPAPVQNQAPAVSHNPVPPPATPPRVGPTVTFAPAPAAGRPAAAPPPATKSSAAPSPTAPPPAAPPASAAHPPATLMNVQDLAIAFHLSGHTAGDPSTGRRRHRRGHWRDRLRKLVVLALAAVMLALAGAVVAVAKPEWRGGAVGWTKARVTDVRAWLDSFSKPVTPGETTAPKPAPRSQSGDDGVG